MRSELPTYLVQDQQGVLNAYWNRDILRFDLAVNKQNPPKQIFKLGHEKLATRYKRLIGRP